MIEQLTAKARRRGRLRSSAVRFALGRTRALAGIRELPKYDSCWCWPSAQRGRLGAIGPRSAPAAVSRRADDVFFLTLTEASEAIDGGAAGRLIAERREAV